MTVKEQAREIVEKLPETATWDDVAYEVYIQQKIARGIADLEAGRVVSDEEIRRQFLK